VEVNRKLIAHRCAARKLSSTMLQVKTRRGDGEGEEEQQELEGRSSSRSWRREEDGFNFHQGGGLERSIIWQVDL